MEAPKSLFSRILSKFSRQEDSDSKAEIVNKKKPPPKKIYSLEEIQGLSDVDVLLKLCNDKDGYKRELATKQLGALNYQLAIPKFIELCNNWVPQVRVVAKEALMRLAIPDNAENFVLNLPNLYHLKKCQRGEHAKLIKAIEEFLCSEENALHVVDGMSSDNPKVKAACYQLVIKNHLIAPDRFILKALKQQEKSIRIKAASYLQSLDGDIKDQALQVAINDKHMLVRRDALLCLLKIWGNDQLARDALFDPSPSIREIAVSHLVKAGTDVQYTYLRSLSEDDPKVLCTAIWGLGYLNGVECSELIHSFTKHEEPTVRKQAVETLANLASGPKKFTDTVEWNSTSTRL